MNPPYPQEVPIPQVPPKAIRPGEPADAIPGTESFGSAPALRTLYGLLDAPDAPSTILINVLTMARNRYVNEMDARTLVTQLATEVKEVIKDLTPALERQASASLEPLVVFYLFDYEKQVPQPSFRESHSKLRAMLDQVEDILFKIFENYNSVRNGVRIIMVRSKDSAWSYKTLLRLTNQHNTVHNIAMISHIPIDYHVSHQHRKFRLVQSFTGSVVEFTQLGDKVFDDPNVPFNRVTHAILGDRTYIKPTLSRKMRMDLAGQASAQHWNVRTEAWCREELPRLGYPIPYSMF